MVMEKIVKMRNWHKSKCYDVNCNRELGFQANGKRKMVNLVLNQMVEEQMVNEQMKKEQTICVQMILVHLVKEQMTIKQIIKKPNRKISHGNRAKGKRGNGVGK